MTKREAYIRHCGKLGISRGLAELMADETGSYAMDGRYDTASVLLSCSFVWLLSEQGYWFWSGVHEMLEEMTKTGECK